MTAPPKPLESLSPELHKQWDARQARLAAVEEWSLRGRVALHQGEERWTGRIAWQQRGDAFTIHFFSPLGQAALRLEGDANAAVLWVARQREPLSGTVNEVLREAVGWDVPLAQLRYWVLGIPDPAATATVRIDTHGRLAVLAQAGWRVELPRYVAVSATTGDLPARLMVSGFGMRAQLVVDEWEVAAAAGVTAEPALPAFMAGRLVQGGGSSVAPPG